MKRLLVPMLVLGLGSACAQNPAGHYEGAVSRDGSVQLISADFETVDGRLTGTFDIPELMDFEMRIPPAEWRKDTLVLWLNYGNFLCRYFPATDEITGLSEGWSPKVRLHLKKGGRKEIHFRREEVAFENDGIRLAGLLFVPLPESTRAFVVLVHGSGDVDRESPYYHSLGYALAERGIGVLLYDKRGCGNSTGDWKSASMGDLAGDAAAAMKYLRGRSELGLSKAGYLGTSQGGWISAIAANRNRPCDFVIFNVGPSVSVFDQDIHRVKYSMMSDGVPNPAIDSAVEYTRSYFRFTRSRSAEDWKSLSSFADAIRAREWAGFVNFPDSVDDFAWWRNNDYDPAEDLKRIRCPVLSILGELDVLVPPAENEARMDSLLRLSGTRYKVAVIPRVGHDELTFQGLNGRDWNWPESYWQWRKRPEVIIETIVGWLRE